MCKITDIKVIDPEVYLTIVDGKNKIIVFCDNDKFTIGQKIDEIFEAISAMNIVKVNNLCNETHIFYEDTGVQDICGILEDKKKGIISVGNIKIHISDYIPKDIGENELIQFKAQRIDLWR